MFIRPKDGSMIATELGCTRQAVSNILKRAMKKFYIEAGKIDETWGPFDRSVSMMKMFNVDHNADDIKKFYTLFPPDVRKEIEQDALENHCSRRMKESLSK